VQLLIDITPGDPARIIAGSTATQAEYEKIQEELGLNDPFFVRYIRFIKNAAQGNFGTSYASRRSVWDDISSRFPYTLMLVAFSIGFSVLIGIPIGVYAATHQYTWKDNTAILASLFCVSMPNFWFALLIVQFFAVKLRILPPAGADTWQGWIMPVISLTLGYTATVARQIRSDMLEVIRQDYVVTARAKGQSEGKVLYRHALKNALIPVIMVIGTVFGLSLGGALVTETIFSLPGLGTYVITGLSGLDYPVIQATILFLSAMFSIVILIVDIIFAFVDPRIRSQYIKKKKREVAIHSGRA
jgi:peptide/nickel transport system permease protein